MTLVDVAVFVACGLAVATLVAYAASLLGAVMAMLLSAQVDAIERAVRRLRDFIRG